MARARRGIRHVSVTASHLARIRLAENAWRAAAKEDERHGTAATVKAEQDAWDAYAQLCDDAQICLQPGCSVLSPEQAWCPEHGSK